MKKRIQIEDIQPLKESFQVPEGYFDSLADKINAKKGDQNKQIRLEDIEKLEDSYQVPEGYFDGLVDKIEERKELENNVVGFRKTRIKIWGSMVAAACIAIVVLSVVDWGGDKSNQFTDQGGLDSTLAIHIKNIPDSEIACLMDDGCNEEFMLTDDEIIDVIEHETKQTESTAIIDFLQDDGTLEDGSGTGDEDFIDEI